MLTSNEVKRARENYNSLLNNKGLKPEMEVRFGFFTGGRFNSELTATGCNNIFSHYHLNHQRITDTIYGYTNGESLRLRNIDGETIEEVKRKYPSLNIDIEEYSLRIAFALESNEERKIPNVKPYIRNKDVYYTELDSGYRLELMEIHMGNSNVKQLELEVTNDPNLDRLQETVESVYRILHGTELIYTISEKRSLVNDFNKINKIRSTSHNISRYPITQVRNLHLKDMVYGGLIGGKTQYTVTYKSDGLRRLLCFNKVGLWIIYPDSYNLVIRHDYGVYNVMDCELIISSSRKYTDIIPRAKYWVSVFDTLIINGTNGIQSQPHSIRLARGQSFIKSSFTPQSLETQTQGSLLANVKLNDGRYINENVEVENRNIMEITFKPFWALRSPIDFYTIMNDLFNQEELQPYITDGFIFTPESIYNPHSESIPFSERILTMHPDVCKWKPQEMITNDFRIVKGKDVKLYVVSSNKSSKEEVLFTGTEYHHYSGSVPLTKMFDNIPNYSIVEFAWDKDNQELIPLKVRYDKGGPNNKNVAMDNWTLIMNPITKDILIGQDFSQVYRYHNNIKRDLYNALARKDDILLDIGSGKGGDISKWGKFGHIFAVEPNKEHREEFMRRLVHKDKVTLLPLNAYEDKEEITNKIREKYPDGVDIISFMLSLSFFWKSEEILDSIVSLIDNNLKAGGKVIFLTIDGNAIKESFSPTLGGLVSSSKILGPVSMELKGNTVDINIKDSIVENQEEYLVFISDLRIKLDNIGIKFIEYQQADREKFLPQSGLIFTQYYFYGFFKRNGKGSMSKSTKPVKWIPKGNRGLSEMLGSSQRTGYRPKKKPSPSPSPSSPSPPPSPSVSSSSPSPSPLGSDLIPYLAIGGKVRDDDYDKINLVGYKGYVVRIATLGEGNCLIHAFLKCVSEKYREIDNRERREMARKFRSQIGAMLEKNVKDDITYYEAVSDGQFMSMLLNCILNRKCGINYTLYGQIALYNSSKYLGDEAISVLSYIFKVDIYIMSLEKSGLKYIDSVIHIDNERAIIISGTQNIHYEVIGRKENDNKITVLFKTSDSIIKYIRSQIGDVEILPPTGNPNKEDIKGNVNRVYEGILRNSEPKYIKSMNEVLMRIKEDSPNEPILKYINIS
jgi:hypothetical protein